MAAELCRFRDADTPMKQIMLVVILAAATSTFARLGDTQKEFEQANPDFKYVGESPGNEPNTMVRQYADARDGMVAQIAFGADGKVIMEAYSDLSGKIPESALVTLAKSYGYDFSALEKISVSAPWKNLVLHRDFWFSDDHKFCIGVADALVNDSIASTMTVAGEQVAPTLYQNSTEKRSEAPAKTSATMKFWNAVVGGLKVLTFWETYVAALEYLALFMGPMILVGLAMEKGGEKSEGVVGCLGMLIIPVLQVAALAVFVLTLAPIILDVAEDAAWSLPWKFITLTPGVSLQLLGILIVAAVLLNFVPFLGQLRSLQTLLLGGIALASFALGIVKSVNPELASGKLDLIPGIWFTVGLLIVGAIMNWVGLLVAALLVAAIDSASEKGGKFGELIMYPVAAIFGFIPIFIYGAWLGVQLKHGL